MKSNVLLLLAVVLLPYTSSEEGTCAYGGHDIPDGDRVYDFLSENGINKCAIVNCSAFPIPAYSVREVLCTEVSDNCSVPSTPHEQNLATCCNYCSECDFLFCPEHSSCVQNDGALCQCLPGYKEKMFNEQLSCADINECAVGMYDCPANSDCVNVPGAFNCSCHSGYGGNACTDIDECVEIPGICPSNSQCVNHDGFYECVCNNECQIDINSYYLTTPTDPADFFAHNQGCSPDPGSFPGQSMVVCTGHQQLLTEDRSTEAGIPPTPSQYVGWDRNQGNLDGFTIIIDADHTRLTRLDIHFYHNPSAAIGLPEVSSIYASSSQANETVIGPLSFVYARNEDLAQNDNRIRTVSIIITDNPDSNGFYQFVRISFVYSSSIIWRTQLTKIQAYGGTGFIEDEEEITFLSGSSQVIHLEVDEVVSEVDLRCTVANSGSFMWEWTKASDGAVLTSGVNQADLTRTSVLTIDRLSMEDSGEYVCRAFQGSQSSALKGTATIVLELGYDVIKDVPTEYVNQSDATITCEFVGYYPKEEFSVQWDFEGHTLGQDGGKYSISHDTGRRGQSQSGRDFVGSSLISSLTILSLGESDKGIYGCRIIGDSCHQLIGYIQIGHVAAAAAAPLSVESCSDEESTAAIGTGSVWFFLFLLELVIIAVMILVIVLFICIFYYKHRHGNLNSENNKEKDCTSPESKVPDDKYVIDNNMPVYAAITTPADYEVFRTPASYEEVVHSPNGIDRKEPK